MIRFLVVPVLSALLVLGACRHPAPPEPPVDARMPATPQEPPADAGPDDAVADLRADGARGVEDEALAELLADHWEHAMATSPVWATMLGYEGFDERLGDPSREAELADRAATRAFLERAEALDPATMGEADALTLALFEADLRRDLATDVCERSLWNVSPRSNALVFLNYLPEMHPWEDPRDARALYARYEAIPGWIEARIAVLRLGLEQGRTPPRESLERVIEQVGTALAEPIEGWPLMRPTRRERDLGVEPGAWGELVAERIRPALQVYLAFLESEVLPAARGPEAVGVHALPDGEACYDALIESHTTLDRSADDLHATGLAELESVHAELAVLGEGLFGTRERAAIVETLRTDEDLYFDSAEAIETKAEAAVAAAREAMPAWFGTLPEAEVVVRRVPAYEAPYTTIAYYRAPAPDGSKPGEYFVNVHAPETRPRYEAEVLAFHEAIPGHHLQIAIAQELPDMPAFRRHGGVTAFVEGWGLYSERLSEEMGLYSGDLDRVGMLSFDTWRAARLVVDTGIHAEGWSREQAVAFMVENTPLAKNNIDNEVDRYINTPGQALAYKTGQLAILGLRAEAEQALGEAFDVAAFHDVVLGAGAVPLPVLEDRVDAWIDRQRSGPVLPVERGDDVGDPSP